MSTTVGWQIPSRRALLLNAGALTGSHAISLLASLATVPYLARTLGPEAWAPVLLAQALALWVVMVLEFGFDLSATRALAIARGHDAPAAALQRLVWDVQMAKVVLIPLAMCLLVGTAIALPALRADIPLFVGTVVFALARGLAPLWYFLGVERVRRAITIDTAMKVLSALAVFAVVHEPTHGWRVLALQACGALVSLGVLTQLLRRSVPLPRLSFAGARRALTAGGTLFAVRAFGTLYLHANTLLLGALAPTAAVAHFGSAEKLVRAVLNVLEPITRVLLARLSFLRAADAGAANRFIVVLLAASAAGGTLGAAAVGFLAPFIVRVMLGDGYEAAVPVLRVLSLLLPVIAVGTVLGMLWAVPAGRDRLLLRATAAAGLLNLALVPWLVPRYAAVGMALGVLGAELLVVLVLAVGFLRAQSRSPAVVTVPSHGVSASTITTCPADATAADASTPCVYILCAVHNGALYLEEFLASVAAQSRTHWRLLLRDDASGDASPALLVQAAAHDPRIVVLPSSGHQLGAAGSFAWLWDHVPPDAAYIMFADQDDVWDPRKIEWSLDAMLAAEREHGGALLVHTDLEVVDAQLQPIASSFWTSAGIRPQPATLRRLTPHNVVTGCTALVNRALRERAGSIPAECAMHDWWLALVAVAFGRVIALPVATVRYRQHDTNTIGARTALQQQPWRHWPGLAVRALSRGGAVRADIAVAARQARALSLRFATELSAPERTFLEAYARIPAAAWLPRKLAVMRLHLLSEFGWIRNAGVLWRA